MSLVTPSDRFLSSAKRFFLLRRLDAPRLLRSVWALALLVYGIQFLLSALSIWSYFGSNSNSSEFWLQFLVISPFLFRIVEPLLWLFIIRLVLEICLRQLTTPGQDRA